MLPIIALDNSIKKLTDEEMALDGLKFLADTNLGALKNSSGRDLWLFPSAKMRHGDKIEKESIFSIENGNLVTNNIMGFVGYGDTQLTIRSRFTKEDGNDWFMQYMLQKVFAINVFDLMHSTGNDNSLDIATLMLPYFLQKALRQGLYREYTKQNYNDSKIRGSIDISRHIKDNFPFKNGKIAYSTRVYVYDNPITQLVRHTIEYIKTKKSSMSSILYSSTETQAIIKQIVGATPSYRKGDLHKVIAANLKPKVHPFYSEYRPLQAICLKILQNKKISYGVSPKHVYGLLFDGAWLWEEYLNLTFQKAGYEHPENRKKMLGRNVFSNLDRHTIYPDFIKNNIVADAKYKRLLDQTKNGVSDNISRDDINQMVTYLHVTKAENGVFVNPVNFAVPDGKGGFYPETAFNTRVGVLNGLGGTIYIIGLNIPRECANYKEFVQHMTNNEEVLLQKIKTLEP